MSGPYISPTYTSSTCPPASSCSPSRYICNGTTGSCYSILDWWYRTFVQPENPAPSVTEMHIHRRQRLLSLHPLHLPYPIRVSFRWFLRLWKAPLSCCWRPTIKIGWVEVYASTSGTHTSGADGLIKHLRSRFASFGVPEEINSDGDPEFTSGCTENFLERWGVRHRISLAYFPQSNGRAEVAVKKGKRLLLSSTEPTGSLDNDEFIRAMRQLRNTPDPDCNISPAQTTHTRRVLVCEQVRKVF